MKKLDKHFKEFILYILMAIVASIATISLIWVFGAMLTPESSLKALVVLIISVIVWLYLLKKL